MKAKRLLLSILFLFICFWIYSKPRSNAEALIIANQFYNNSSNRQKMVTDKETLQLAYTAKPTVLTKSSELSNYYYVFNRPNHNGFIIISGDDVAKDVLGYSDNGSFYIDSIPSNFRYWLIGYQKEIDYYFDHSEKSSIPTILQTKAITNNFLPSVPPLLGGIKWNQGSPYNDLCPLMPNGNRSVTGCVATAMAQVMRYYKYPNVGLGSMTYTPPQIGKVLSLDFSKTILDWNNMTETYSTGSSATEKSAVATLMYNCGVSVRMNYWNSSGALTSSMAYALIENWGYDSKLQYIDRLYFTKDEWTNILKNELNVKRPVLYGGNSDSGGHQFICDGYNSSNLFHFNWGWGGSSDGYFELSALNPSSLGIGGGNGGGFNYGQDIVIGVQSPNFAPLERTCFLTTTGIYVGTSNIDRTGVFSLKIYNAANKGLFNFSGIWNFALYDGDNFVALVSSSLNQTLNVNNKYTEYPFNGTVPATVPNGSYRVYPVYKADDQTEWHRFNCPSGNSNYINATITSSNITFGTVNLVPQLNLNSFTTSNNLYQNKLCNVKFSITNQGIEFASSISVVLESVANPTITQTLLDASPYVLSSGETKVIDLYETISVAPGQYKMTIYYDSDNNIENTNVMNQILGTPINVNVLSAPTEDPSLTAVAPATFANPLNVNKNCALLSVKVKNTGGVYANDIIAYIFSESGSGTSLSYFGYQNMIIDKNEEQTIQFTGPINLVIGNYRVGIFYSNTSNKFTALLPYTYTSIPFTLTDIPTGLESHTVDKVTLYPNPVDDILFIKSDELIRSVSIKDISGSTVYSTSPNEIGDLSIPVEHLNKGIYLILVELESGNQTLKFLKN